MNTTIASVQDVINSLERFGVADYVVFVLMLAVCAVIGIYYGFFDGEVTAAKYLDGGKNMNTFPVSLSLIASIISGITLLGTPTEIYVYGAQYVYFCIGIFLMTPLVNKAYIPVFRELGISFTYEYLQRRFNKKVRLLGSMLFIVKQVVWLPIVMYVPALAFSLVTGIDVHIISPLVCVVCIFYTCVGGLKAVIWTDVIQSGFIFGSVLLVIIKGTLDVGGPSVVWERNYNSGRLEAPVWDVDPTVRHTVWSLVFGGSCMWLVTNAVDQGMTQRYMALGTAKQASMALWISTIGVIVLILTSCYSGMVIFATYHDCDPLTSNLVQAKDQLLPLLVMNTLGKMPGIPGMFLAGIFSAALSTLSTGLNSMAGVILEDFCKPHRKKPLTERQMSIIMKTVVVVAGLMCIALVFVVEKLGTVLQMMSSLAGIANGPLIGVFTAGLFLPWVNSKGVFIGGLSGLGFVAWLSLGAQAAIASNRLTFPTKPVSVEGCTYSFVSHNSTTTVPLDTEVFGAYRLSYMWYYMVGCVVTILVSVVVSLLTQSKDVSPVDPKLLSPLIRRFMPTKKKDKLGADIVLIGMKNDFEDSQKENPTSEQFGLQINQSSIT